MRFGKHLIGSGERPIVIAEVGFNHNGDVATALEMVKVAADVGADCVKFQIVDADAFLPKKLAKSADEQRTSQEEENLYDELKRTALSADDYGAIAAACRDADVEFLASFTETDTIALLTQLGVPALKIASGELTNTPLLRRAAAAGLPLIMSTGMASLGEVEAALAAVESSGVDVCLLHATSRYPADEEDANLRAIITMRDTFDVLVGYSDHTEGVLSAAIAVALGGAIIEKHFTLDRSQPGCDHAMSVEPEGLRELVETVRSVTAQLGDGRKLPRPSEVEMRVLARRNLVARKAIPAGTCITAEMLTCKRPLVDLPPAAIEDVCGREAAVDIPEDAPITRAMIRW